MPTPRHGILSPTEAAYLAGIIDGEGSVTIDRERKSGRTSLRLSVTNTDLLLIAWMRDRLGGSLARTGGGTEGRRQVYQLCWRGPTAVEVLAQVEPYLVVKLRQAQLAAVFQRLVRRNGPGQSRALPPEIHVERSLLRDEMQSLNRGGL